MIIDISIHTFLTNSEYGHCSSIINIYIFRSSFYFTYCLFAKAFHMLRTFIILYVLVLDFFPCLLYICL